MGKLETSSGIIKQLWNVYTIESELESVVDRDVFVEVGWRDTPLNEISTPWTKIDLVISVLKVHISPKLYSAAKSTPSCGLGSLPRKTISRLSFGQRSSEATHEFNKVLSLAYNPSEDEVNKTQLLFGLVNAATIHFGMLKPTNIENALKLITYLRKAVCADGMQIRSLLQWQPIKFNYKLKIALLKLPNEAVKLRPFKTKHTPIDKRPRYVIEEDKEKELSNEI
ncbi:18747_t:CDS:2 [Dentiscutata erythropus]|uniref:18747_t:CDS:1 n=1 Tax=Dentiscutata erythropus TaxID=1348616 RepID=A0A9N9E056_9GLOM|nr:18747_t:CDS:2 [Dentiscutata erythropus]